jgi:hypothetical protein
MQLSSNAYDVEQDFCIKLVHAVGKNPCLYNYKLSDDSRKDVVDKAWVEVRKEDRSKDATVQKKSNGPQR